MANRSLELTIISAKGLNKFNLVGKMDVYVVVYINGAANQDQKQKTHIHVGGDANPTWNYKMKFRIDESAALQNRLMLVAKIKTEGLFGHKDLGEVHVPIKELLQGSGNPLQFVSYQVRKPSGKPKGELSFSYKFNEKVNGFSLVNDPVTAFFSGKPNKSDEPVTAYPAVVSAPVGGYLPPARYPQPQAGYAYQHQQKLAYGDYAQPPLQGYSGYSLQPGYGGYPPQQPGYGYPPVQQPQKPKKKNKFGMGLGAGLLGGALGGLLIGDVVSDAADGGACSGF